MPLPARLAPVLLTVGDPTDATGWVYSLESVVGVIEQPTSNVNLIPLITPAKGGYGLFDHRVFEIGDPDIIIDGDTVSIETPSLFPNVMASDPTRQVGGAYRYTVTLRAELDPRKTAWTYDFRFIIDGDASYTLVGTAIPVAQVSSINPADPSDPEWVALLSRVADLEAAGGHSPVTLAGETYLSLVGQEITADPIAVGELEATGTPSATTYLRGDGTWSTPAGGITASSADTLTNKTLDSFTNEIHADVVHLEVRNESGGLLTKGTPVYYSGYSIGQDKVLVSPADASDRATMLCLGLLNEDLAHNATGDLLRTGRIYDIDTSAWSAGDQLFVSETAGELTNVAPTGAAFVQHVAEVMRSHASLGTVSLNLSADHRTGLANLLMEDGTQAAMRTRIGAAALEMWADSTDLMVPSNGDRILLQSGHTIAFPATTGLDGHSVYMAPVNQDWGTLVFELTGPVQAGTNDLGGQDVAVFIADETSGEWLLMTSGYGTSSITQQSEETPGYEVWLKIGQSNSIGRDPANVLGVDEAQNPRLFELSQGNTRDIYVPPAAGEIDQHNPMAQDDNLENGVSPGYYFGLRRCDLNPQLKVLMVHAAVGGTGFGDNEWNPGDPQYNFAVAEAITAMGIPGARFGGFLWHQGEADSAVAGPDLTQSEYEVALAAMVAAMRLAIPGAAVAPFIIGTVKSTSTQYDADINLAHKNIANYVPNGHWIDCESYTLFDGLHFDQAGLKLMGRAWADKAQSVLSGVESNIAIVDLIARVEALETP